jgi:hypothetical protein
MRRKVELIIRFVEEGVKPSEVERWDNHLQERAKEVLISSLIRGASRVYEAPLQDTVVIGDLHGDLESLLAILKREAVENEHMQYIFMGDYIDRGPRQLEVLFTVLNFKTIEPRRVFLLKGNHEDWLIKDGELVPKAVGDEDSMFLSFWSRHGISFGTLNLLRCFFEQLPHILVLGGTVGIVHGGIPRPRNNYDFIRGLRSLDNKEILDEMLWSDPENKEDVLITGETRFSFGRRQFDAFMERVGWSLLLRSHEPHSQGYQIFFDKRLVSLFSTGRLNSGDNTYYDYVRPVYGIITRSWLEIREVSTGDMVDVVFLNPTLNLRR